MKEYLKYLYGLLFGKRIGVCRLTILRRYHTDAGYVGELYVDGKYVGMTCDNLVNHNDIANIDFVDGYRTLRNNLMLMEAGSFDKVPLNVIRVGSLVPSENDVVMPLVLSNCRRVAAIKLAVINKLLIER